MSNYNNLGEPTPSGRSNIWKYVLIVLGVLLAIWLVSALVDNGRDAAETDAVTTEETTTEVTRDVDTETDTVTVTEEEPVEGEAVVVEDDAELEE